MAKLVLFAPHNHFDPTWRRCFDRSAVYNDTVVRSYAEVEEHCIETWLPLASRGYPFSEGQTAVWRKYLERRPERKEALKKAAREGTLEIMRAGETVQDTTMPAAEGLVRNFLMAEPLYRELLPADHAGLKLAWLEDAFGNSPNYPQVLAGVGAEVACNTSYRFCPEEVWVGIDGTKIACYDHFPAVRGGAYEKHAPCDECRGKGCDTCKKTGLRFVPGFNQVDTERAMEQACEKEGDWVGFFLQTEEVLPDGRLIDLVQRVGNKYAGKSEIRFANPSDHYAAHKPVLDRAMIERADSPPTTDLNPAMPGCYVTRIKNKQRVRAITYKLVQAEAGIATRSFAAGKPVTLPADFAAAWQRVAFNQFHDAITGTLIDSANTELHDMLDEAEAIADRHGADTKTSSTIATFKTIHEKAPTTRRIGPFDITFDRSGIHAILINGQNVFGKLTNGRMRRDFRIAELALDSDFGDAWGQRIMPFSSVSTNCALVPLGEYNQSVEATDRSIRWEGKYTGGDPMVKRLAWTITMSLSGDGKRLDFATDVDWDTHSRRLRMLVPVDSTDPMATYEVPFGFIDRKYEPEKFDYSQWRSNTMEWPTLHWVHKKIDERRGVALLNKGLPCNRWMTGVLDLSLVRSPEWAFCAVEPVNYEFWDIDGQRDTGKHRFEYSLWPHVERLEAGDLTRAGYAYNDGSPKDMPSFKIEGDVVVTAWKPAEAGDGWILRVQEAAGRGTTVSVDLGRACNVARTNLLEVPSESATKSARFSSKLHRHGILTVKIS